MAKFNKMDKHNGSWYCGNCDAWNYAHHEKCCSCANMFEQAEFFMGNEDELPNLPSTQASPDRTEKQKKDAYFGANGRFMKQSKPKFR
jgi:hypothetical protein